MYSCLFNFSHQNCVTMTTILRSRYRSLENPYQSTTKRALHFQCACHPKCCNVNFSLDSQIRTQQSWYKSACEVIRAQDFAETGCIDPLTAKENHHWFPDLSNWVQIYKEMDKNGGETERDAKKENKAQRKHKMARNEGKSKRSETPCWQAALCAVGHCEAKHSRPLRQLPL